MLNIIFGDVDNSIYNTDVYFNNSYEEEWITNELAKEIIFDIDKSEVLGAECINSPILGAIPPTKLSGGVKTLILVNSESDKLFNASTCGDNCAKWLLKMGKDKDITINLRHIMDFGKEPFEVFVVNTKEVINSMKELIPVANNLI